MEVKDSEVASVSLEIDVSIEKFEINVGDGGFLSGRGCGRLVVVGVSSFVVVSVGYQVSRGNPN